MSNERVGQLVLKNCKMRIGRVSAGGGDYVSVEIEDWDSGCFLVMAKLSLEQFGEVLTGRFAELQEVEFNQSKSIGKKEEVLTVLVPVEADWGWNQRPEKLEAAIDAFMKENHPEWVADDTHWNSHKVSRKGGQTFHEVNIRRWV